MISHSGKVLLHYFASLGEAIGCDQEEWDVGQGENGRSLFYQIMEKHGLDLKISYYRLAVNDEIVEFDHPIKNGDFVVFMPPVSGG